jgi:tRNA threonylcarbamoyladenosine biosynthesis protein TsaB
VKILAFDTATAATTVALAGFGVRTLEARDDPAPGQRPGHATRLLPLIAELLDQADARWGDLERLAVGVGPGTFTGLRIGVATARALSHASGVPLVGVSTLRSLAEGALTEVADGEYVLAAMDARRGEAFAAAWRRDTPRERVLPPQAIGPDALAERVAGLPPGVLAVGDGAIKWRPVLERSGAFLPPDGSDLHKVRARVHAEIARRLPAGDPDDVAPEYLRVPDAEIARRAADRR